MVLKLVNITLLVINAIVFFLPKRPLNNLNSNAAGILALIALLIIGVFVVHLIFTVVAIYFNKIWLLKISAILMVPASLVFWFYAVPMIKFLK